jgi:hypothetical protein
MRSFSRLLQSSPFLVWLAVAAVPACSGASPEGMDAVRDSNETFVTERGARGSSAANGSLGKNETVAYIDVERVTIAAPDRRR